MKAIDRQDLARVVKEMGRLGDRFILIGGCAPWFLLDAAFVPQVRPTLDLDFVVEVVTHLEYTRLEEKLRKIGFRHDTRPGAPRCRWLLGDIQVDVQSALDAVQGHISPESPPGAVLRLLQHIDKIIEDAASASR